MFFSSSGNCLLFTLIVPVTLMPISMWYFGNLSDVQKLSMYKLQPLPKYLSIRVASGILSVIRTPSSSSSKLWCYIPMANNKVQENSIRCPQLVKFYAKPCCLRFYVLLEAWSPLEENKALINADIFSW